MPKKKADDRKLTKKINKLRVIEPGVNKEIKNTVENLCLTLEDYRQQEKLERKDYDELLKLYKEAIEEIDASMQKISLSDTTEMRKNKNKLRKTLAKDFRTFYELSKKSDEEIPEKLDDVFENSRAVTKTVDISEVKKDNSGGQHVRLVVPLGNKKVYFSESEVSKRFFERLPELVENTKKNFGKSADFLKDEDNLAAIRAFIDKGEEKLKDLRSGIRANSIADIKKNIEDNLRACTTIHPQRVEKLLNSLNTPDRIMTFMDMMHAAGKMAFTDSTNRDNGLPESGVKMDKRNSAMSVVAELFGCGDVIAKSRNMNLVIKDKDKTIKTVKGTAMDECVGCDLYKMDYDSELYNRLSEDSLENNPKLVRQIADIQALDFICGNFDRHMGNIMYGFDKNGKLLIQGFDNDGSFIASDKGFEGYKGGCIGPAMMGIVTKEMADKIKAIDENDFKLMLFGFDLNNEEVGYACSRLNTMKEVIAESEKIYANKPDGYLKDNCPRIVEEKDLGKYSIKKDLAKRHGLYYNMFSTLSTDIEKYKKGFLVTDAVGDLADSRSAIFSEGFAKIEPFDGRIDKVVHWYTKGSEKFDNMRKALATVEKMQKKLSGNVLDEEKLAGDGKNYTLNNEMKEYRAALKNLKETTDIYLEGKVNDKKKNKVGSRAWNRYHIVKDLGKEAERQLKAIEKLEKSAEIYSDFTQDKLRKPNNLAGAKENAININEPKKNVPKAAGSKGGSNMQEVFGQIEGLKSLCDEFVGGSKEDISSINDTALQYRIAENFAFCEGQKPSELAKNPENFERFKKGIAGLVVKSIKQDQNMRRNNGFSDAFGKCADFRTGKIVDIDAAVENVMKNEKFGQLIDTIKKEDKFTVKAGSVEKFIKANDHKTENWSKSVTKIYNDMKKQKNAAL